MLNDAPFIKVEATKFTEVGYHGRDVEKIIVDLLDISIALTKKKETEKVKEKAAGIVEEKLLERLMGPTRSIVMTKKSKADTNEDDSGDEQSEKENAKSKKESSSANTTRDAESFRSMLKDGLLEDQEVDIDVPLNAGRGNDFTVNEGGGSGATFQIRVNDNREQGGRSPNQKKKLPISEARKILLEAEIEKQLQRIDITKEAIAAVEETGIVFLDEIDKICTARSSGRTTDASAEGVQRDLLPLVEGTTVSTKHGNVNTDYILFVASGAFHAVKPSDMLPELQGRLPVRVELKGLTEDDMYKILTEPVANVSLVPLLFGLDSFSCCKFKVLTFSPFHLCDNYQMLRQQIELLKTEGVELVFEEEAIREIARMAADLNKSVENIGARRLHTVLERIMEEFSFQAAEDGSDGATYTVTKEVVEGRMKDVTKKTDLARFIL